MYVCLPSIPLSLEQQLLKLMQQRRMNPGEAHSPQVPSNSQSLAHTQGLIFADPPGQGSLMDHLPRCKIQALKGDTIVPCMQQVLRITVHGYLLRCWESAGRKQLLPLSSCRGQREVKCAMKPCACDALEYKSRALTWDPTWPTMCHLTFQGDSAAFPDLLFSFIQPLPPALPHSIS